MHMQLKVVAIVVAAGVFWTMVARAQSPAPQPWNNPGFTWTPADPPPIPARDLSGLWDAGAAGISGTGQQTSPLTAWGQEAARAHKPGNGPRAVPVPEINDPLSTLCAPSGFPRIVLYETRPFQIVQLQGRTLILYMFEQRWRTIWTDGRQLPRDPDPRWYGYSVGRWDDDRTFVVNTVGLTEDTWLDNAGNPHSSEMRVEERYRRVAYDMLELTVTIDDPKAYTKSWLGRDRLRLKLLPSNTDLIEMICSPEEAREYQRLSGAAGASAR